MKPIKLLFSISLLLFINNLKSQSFFEDSASYYTYSSAYNLGGGSFVPSLYKEQVFLDSITSSGEHYHVKPSNYIYIHQLELSKNYNLRVLDSQVFFTGFLFRDDKDSFWNENLLIYDYTLKVGDTLSINFNSPSDTVSVLIDSISTMQTLDGQYRMVQYFSPLNGSSIRHVRNLINETNFNIMGLCGINGFLPYLKFYRSKSLFSVCKSDELIYQNDSFISHFERDLKSYGYQYGQTIINNSCNLDSLENMIWLINKLDINTTVKTSFKIYPNPTHQLIQIEGLENSVYKIFNAKGQLINQSVLDKTIDISHLQSGLYWIHIQNQNQTYSSKFIKN